MRRAALVVGLLALPFSAAAQDVPVWTAEPSLRIGVALGDPDYEFGRIMGAVRLSDGTIVVGEIETKEIRFFDASGKLIRRQGREGEGPGEYRYVRYVLTCGGDRVWIYDTALIRLTVLDSEGTVLATHLGPTPDGRRGPYELRCDRQGRFIAPSWAQGESEALRSGKSGPFRGTQVVVLADGEGVVRDTIGTFPSGERYLFRRADGSPGGTGPRVFGPETHVAIGGGRAFIGDAAAPWVVVYEGRGLDTLHLPLTRREIAAADLDTFRAGRLAAAEDANHERRLRQYWDDYDFPDDYPFYSDLRVDEAGLLWVRPYPAEREVDVEWLILDPTTGDALARAVLPAALEVTQIGEDFVLGILETEGVEVVQQYRLRRDASADH